jgi:hypothetical protein
MHVHVDPALDADHRADPYDQLLRAGICRRCRRPTREPAMPVAPFVRRALAAELPAKVVR